MFQPKILRPYPDPVYVRELQLIDPSLQVVWGSQRYLLSRWVIERRLSPERYHSMYRSFLESGEPRFIQQPVFDTDHPILDENSDVLSYEQIGFREFDLAPEWECVKIVENSDGTYRNLDSRTIMEVKRAYAWEYKHPIERRRIEKQQEQAEREQEQNKKLADSAFREVMEHKRDIWSLPFSGQPETIMEGTEL